MDRTRDDNHKFYILDNPRLTPTWAEGPKELSDATKDLREASREALQLMAGHAPRQIEAPINH
jgi:hypothetical protein